MKNSKFGNVLQKTINSSFARMIFIVLFVIIFFLGNYIALRGEYLTIKQINENYLDVFFKKLSIEYIVFGVNFLVVFISFFITNLFIKKGLRKFFKQDKKVMPKLPNKSIAFVIAILSSFVAKFYLTEKYMLFSNVAWFGINDPIFGKDISFYMFIMPFIQSLMKYIIALVILNLVYTAFYNVIIMNSYLDGIDREQAKNSIFVKQIILTVFVIIVLFAGYIWINSQNILLEEFLSVENVEKTELIGAGATDITVKCVGYRIFSVVIIVLAGFLLSAIKHKDFKKGAVTILMVPTYLIGLLIVMLYTDYIYLGANELDKEKEYIGYNIDFTKYAYGINIEQVDLQGYDTITRDEVEKNRDVLSNISLLTDELVSQALKSNQEDSMHYSYKNSNLGFYTINGKKELMYVTPREVLTQNRTYNNLTYEYTHGYSALLSPVSKIDKNGYLENYSMDTINSQLVKEPRIYFGLQNNSDIIVNSSYGNEYDYFTSATEKAENTYDGPAGLNLGFLDRLILGFRNGNFKLAFSNYITDESKVITERNIISRAKTLLPNIIYDEPYMVINGEGRLIWVIDGYTTSKNFPYSQIINRNYEKINYIRNSVKVLVDAYDGSTKFYITDKADPIINVYKDLYPSIFSENEIPDDIKEHLLYPKMLYSIQSDIIRLYHDVSEDVLYRGDSVWQITSETLKKNTKIDPYYTVVKTKNSDEAELGLVLTYNKYGKQSMTSYLVGIGANGNNKLSLYKFDSSDNVAGMSQINSLIDQDETISKELENLKTTGTKLLREMQIVPIKDTLLYVEKVYQEMLNEPDGVPVLKKIIVASGNVLAMGDSLEEAIANLYSDYSVELDFYDADDMDALIESIIKSNHNLKDSLDSNNFEMIGKDLSSLENLIDQLEKLNKKNKEQEKEIDSKKLDEETEF